MKKVTHLVLTISLLTSTSLVGQNNNVAQPELDSGTIEQQFDYIINKSTSFKEFQLIRKTSILKVKSHALDSIKSIQQNLSSVNNSTSTAQNEISKLKSEVQTLQGEVETIAQDVDSISFVGIPLSKTGYNSIVWLIIASLSIGLLAFIFLFKKSNVVTQKSLTDLEKVNLEFEAFRKKALIKEQETMRKLQDEKNKHSN